MNNFINKVLIHIGLIVIIRFLLVRQINIDIGIEIIIESIMFNLIHNKFTK